VTWTNNDTGEQTSSIGFDVNLGADSGTARLRYTRQSDGEPLDYQITLTTTPLPWGGVKWWFICPLVMGGRYCGRRVAKLYLPCSRYFGCRQCHDLTYTSCQESHEHDRLFREIGRELGLSARDAQRIWQRK
jgi:hypothetical protein